MESGVCHRCQILIMDQWKWKLLSHVWLFVNPWMSSPGQNTGVSSCSLLQGICITQGSNPGLPHCRWILYHLSHQGSPYYYSSVNYIDYAEHYIYSAYLFYDWKFVLILTAFILFPIPLPSLLVTRDLIPFSLNFVWLFLMTNRPITPHEFLLHNIMNQTFYTFQNYHHDKSSYDKSLSKVIT